MKGLFWKLHWWQIVEADSYWKLSKKLTVEVELVSWLGRGLVTSKWGPFWRLIRRAVTKRGLLGQYETHRLRLFFRTFKKIRGRGVCGEAPDRPDSKTE